jgi:hypothetical protein
MGESVMVYSTSDAFQAEMLKAHLESEEIPAMLKGETQGPYRTGSAQLWVPAEDEIRARTLIDAFLSGEYAVDEDELEALATAAEPEQDQDG